MKVKYITEGFFKNPDQARAARAKEAQMSNAEMIADLSNKLTVEPLKNFMNNCIAKFFKQGRIGRYCPDRDQALRGDPFNISPDFMSRFCIVKNRDVYNATRYRYENIVVDDINLQERTISITAILGEACTNFTRNDSVVFATYYDMLSGMVRTDPDREVRDIHTLRSPFKGSNKRLLINKLCYSFFEDAFKELRANKSGYENESSLLELISMLNFDHKNFKYLLTIKWDLQQDVMIFPMLSRNYQDLENACGNDEEALDYMHQWYYPNRKNFPGRTRFNDDEITPETLLKDLEYEEKMMLSFDPRIGVIKEIVQKDIHSIEDLVKMYADSLKNLDIEIIGQGHLYLSTGYFKKDYLIA